jgi:hypothetical protein
MISKKNIFAMFSLTLIMLVIGSILLMTSFSIFVSEWATDRMLHKESDYFKKFTQFSESIIIKQSLSKFNLLADQSSVYQVIGMISVVLGVICTIFGYFAFVSDIKIIKNDKLPVLKFETDTLILIVSSFFAISLIFASMSGQLLSDLEQTLTIMMVQVAGNKELRDTTALTDEIIIKSTNEYAINLAYSTYFAQIAIIFLIAYILTRIHNTSAIILHNHLLVIGIFSFITWIGFYIFVTGITGNSLISEIRIPSPLE